MEEQTWGAATKDISFATQNKNLKAAQSTAQLMKTSQVEAQNLSVQDLMSNRNQIGDDGYFNSYSSLVQKGAMSMVQKSASSDKTSELKNNLMALALQKVKEVKGKK